MEWPTVMIAVATAPLPATNFFSVILSPEVSLIGVQGVYKSPSVVKDGGTLLILPSRVVAEQR